MRLWIGIALVVTATASPSFGQDAGKEDGAALTVARSVLCTGVKDREPAGAVEGSEFPAGTEQAYFFNELKTASPPQPLKHLWYHEGKQVAEIALAAKAERWRTWSAKKVWKGAWKVEVVAEGGTVLATAEFKVGG